MELLVGNRARRAADIVAVHPQDETDEASRVRECPFDVRALVGQRRSLQLNKADIIRAGFEAKLPQPRGVEAGSAGLRSREIAGVCWWKRRTVGWSASFMNDASLMLYMQLFVQRNAAISFLRLAVAAAWPLCLAGQFPPRRATLLPAVVLSPRPGPPSQSVASLEASGGTVDGHLSPALPPAIHVRACVRRCG